ncbi:hypothetical protein RDWZM_007117 [Blomia tropicalis]|uniref:CID domain-containing protein n=1 Tax=Blomia tropicalis TaxID=40697 RepID=A0A9Q0RP81_BLOTA|nr:hypothetical protein RDWZM_007117 [Blomia tropicalis]
MSGFTQQALEKKLTDLNSSQQSIQTLSLWLIHHKKHCRTIVQIWMKELKKAKPPRRLTFMYLANDVIQNGKKKSPEFVKEFLNVLKPCFQFISKEIDEASIGLYDRLIKIWEDRNIFDKNSLSSFRQALHSKNEKSTGVGNNSIEQSKVKNGNDLTSKTSETSKNSISLSPNDTKSSRKRENEDESDRFNNKKLIINNGNDSIEKLDTALLNTVLNKIDSLTNNKPPPIDLDKCEKIEPEKMIKLMKDLQSSASKNATVRDEIAKFPSEVFDTKLIEGVLSTDSLERWTKQVNRAQTILTSYNSQLTQELEDRKKLLSMLDTYIAIQRHALSQAEKDLNECNDKLRNVISVREVLKSHLQNLPDLSQLPSVMPLPSALDLFKL